MKFFGLHSVTLKSFAKINLSLRVVGMSNTRYHLLDSVVLPTTIHDVVEVAINKYAKTTTVICDLPLLQRNHHNICQRAVDAMRTHFGFRENFEIKIHKVIPLAAGMGGGSSNAASVIKAIDSLLKLGASEEKLKEIALEVGADVPFFINPQPTRLRGIGEKLDKINLHHNYYVLLVAPFKGLLTKDVYDAYDALKPGFGNCDALIKCLEDGNDNDLPANIANDLYPAALSLYPELEKDINRVKEFGFPIVSMTGSGSAFFALSTDKKAIRHAELILSEEGYRVTTGEVGNLKQLIK